MSNVASVQTLPGSKVHCRETDEELIFYIPPRPVVGWIAAVLITAVLLACLGFLGFVVYHAGWFVLPFALFVGAIAFIVLGFFFLAVTQRYLTKTFVYVTHGRLVLETILWGREDLERHKLSEQSFARLYWGDPKLWRRSKHIPRTPQGVQIVLEDPSDYSVPVFGGSLAWGEQDWIVWRINRFLGKATNDDVPKGVPTMAETVPIAVEGLPDEPLPPPDGIKVRIEEGVFETQFLFPSTMEMGSRKGVGSVIVGGAIAGFVFFHVIPNVVRDKVGLVFAWVWGLLGLLVALMGLLHLFGRGRLTITP